MAAATADTDTDPQLGMEGRNSVIQGTEAPGGA
jgi:hypothetical protein